MLDMIKRVGNLLSKHQTLWLEDHEALWEAQALVQYFPFLVS